MLRQNSLHQFCAGLARIENDDFEQGWPAMLQMIGNPDDERSGRLWLAVFLP